MPTKSEMRTCCSTQHEALLEAHAALSPMATPQARAKAARTVHAALILGANVPANTEVISILRGVAEYVATHKWPKAGPPPALASAVAALATLQGMAVPGAAAAPPGAAPSPAQQETVQ